MDKEKFGIFSPVSGIQKNIPIILALTPDNINVLLKDGKILRRKMREPTLLDDDEVKVQTPDTFPIIHYHHFVRRSDGSEYLLVFTKRHIYHWNPTDKQFDLKWTNHNIIASTIAFNDNGANPDTITDTGEGFVTAGFVAGDKITVIGSTSNDGDYTINTVVVGTITLIASDTLTTETLGASVTIRVADCENWETVSYNDKVIATNNVDKVLVWDTTGDFEPLDDITNGIEYSRGYSNETNVDETSAKDQKVLKVSSTSGYASTDKIIIDRGGDREEENVVDSVQDGISLTLINNLTYDHTVDAKTTVDADSAGGQKVLNVTSTTGFSEDEFVTINAGGERAETRKIYTIQDGISLTFTVDLTYAHTQAQGDEVVGSAGQEDKVEEYTSYYLTKAKHLTVFENYLILGNTYEHTSYHYQRARWNSIGEEANWLTGTRGSMEVGQSDKITGFGHYQGFLIIFKESSYFKVWLVGIPYIFNKIRLSKEIGCQCGASIVNDSKGRLYWYSSEGTFKEISVGTISDDIQTDIIAKIQPAYVELIKSAFINETEEVLWSIPVESDKNNTLVAFKEGKWLIIDSAVPAFGEFREE